MVNRNTGEKIKWNCEGETKGIEQVKGCRNELIRHVPVTGYGPYICTWTSEEQLAQIKGRCRLKHHTDLKQVFWGRASKKLELGSGFMVFADLSCRSLLPSVWHSFVYLFLVLCFFSQIRYLRKSKGWLLTPEIWEKMVWVEHVCVCSVTWSCLTLFTTWTVAHWAPLSMGFSRQESWSGLPFPSPGDLSYPGIKPTSPSLAGVVFTTVPRG